jgi:cytochrome c biogenesis protein CcdA
MEGVFLGGSLLAAFLAGAIALFAPCCIVVMFPSYLAAAVRNRRWRLLPLTATFAAGIAVVLVPVTLGVTVLTRSLLRFHGPLYVVGGLVLLVLATLAITGKTWTLPMMRGAPDVARTDTGGVFVLGVFSGAASACCAPVLAGVVTLSAVSPSLFQGVALGVAYVFGMVFPLVIMTALWDRLGWGSRPRLRGRTVRWSLAGRSFVTNSFDVVAAGMFALMGIVLIIVGATGATVATQLQTDLSLWLSDRLQPIVAWLEPIPDAVTGLVLVGFGIGAAVVSGRVRASRTNQTRSENDEATEQGNCGEAADTAPAGETV